jgi:hypothetical protein
VNRRDVLFSLCDILHLPKHAGQRGLQELTADAVLDDLLFRTCSYSFSSRLVHSRTCALIIPAVEIPGWAPESGSSRDRDPLPEAVILFARLLPAMLSACTSTMLTACLSRPSDDANCGAQRASASPALVASSRAPCGGGQSAQNIAPKRLFIY